MIRTHEAKENKYFVGRTHELSRLAEIKALPGSKIIVVHGRRRTGKTELIEQFFRNGNVLKFEGLEKGGEKRQQQAFTEQLIHYLGYSAGENIENPTWTSLFKRVADVTSVGPWVLYLEEIQWMSSYTDALIVELKYVWDNFLRKNDQLILVLCGSSPSFIKNKVLRSKALYGRSIHELALKPFSLRETREFLSPGKSDISVLDCYLTVGGIPEYLRYFNGQESVWNTLAKQSFISSGYFATEYERIFVSSFGAKEIYKKIINFLAVNKFASREEIRKKFSIESGGGLTKTLEELIEGGLVADYSPYNSKVGSLLVRYSIDDEYLQFYAKFILPELKNIQQNVYVDNPAKAIRLDIYRQWLGYSLERFCRKNHHKIAAVLGFSGVHYKSGAFFQRGDLNDHRGFQIDLVFKRQDRILTVCEIKYQSESTGTDIIDSFSEKLKRLSVGKQEVQKVLIAPHGVSRALLDRNYFDRILTLKDIMSF